MTFNKAVSAATRHLLRSDKARTADGFVLEMSEDICNPAWLTVDTWGYDRAGVAIPQFRTDLIRRKMRLQLKDGLSTLDKIVFRYLMDILRRESN
jgi:hypothetical protein